MLIKANGKVDVWDKGPPKDAPERGAWLREHRGPVAMEMSPFNASHALKVEPQRYSLERPGI